MYYFHFSHKLTPSLPGSVGHVRSSTQAGMQYCFNVQLTLYGRYKRWIDVEATLCSSWEAFLGAQDERFDLGVE